ncbi:MAG: hypothetical protein ABL967_14460 [Bryobacteraceae bacterium]
MGGNKLGTEQNDTMLSERQIEHIQAATRACERRAVYFREKAEHFRQMDRMFQGAIFLPSVVAMSLQLQGDTLTAAAISLVLFSVCIRRSPLRSRPLAKEGEQIADCWIEIKRAYETLGPNDVNARFDLKELDARTDSLLASSLAYPYDKSGKARLRRFVDAGEMGVLS